MTSIDLAIKGMTCASCSARIERKLGKFDGVSASVNYATETASVTFPDTIAPDQLVAAIESIGYRVTLPPQAHDAAAAPAPDGPGSTTTDSGDRQDADAVRSLRQRLLISLVLTVPVVVLAMVPALQFTYWQWVSLTLASPVVVWGAWPFHRAAGETVSVEVLPQTNRAGEQGHLRPAARTDPRR